MGSSSSLFEADLALPLTESFDLLIVDRMLPNLDGLQVVRRLRAAEVGTPVLMLTARTQVEGQAESEGLRSSPDAC